MARRVAWSRVTRIDDRLLSHVGERLIHPSAKEFDALVAAWKQVAKAEAVIQPFVQACIAEAQRQRAEHPAKDFDVERLDTLIDGAARGLQPADLRAAIGRLPASAVAIRPFLQETLHMLDETVDLLAEVP